MTLKHQLLIASILSLLIPWAGLQLVLGLEAGLRDWQDTQLRARAAQIAAQLQRLASDPQSPPLPGERILYPDRLKRVLYLDGYSDDWPTANGEDGTPDWLPGGDGLRYRLAMDSASLYLLLDVQTRDLQYYQPDRPDQPHEQVFLYRQDDSGLHTRLIRTLAPGSVQANRSGSGRLEQDPLIHGVWQTTAQGYRLELQMPLPPANSRFGIEVIRAGQSLGNLSWQDDQLPRLLMPLPGLSEQLRPFAQVDLDLWIIDAAGQHLASARQDEPVPSPYDDPSDALLDTLGMHLLQRLVTAFMPDPVTLPAVERARVSADFLNRAREQQRPTSQLVRWPGQRTPALVVAHPLPETGQLLLISQSTEAMLSLSSTTLGQVLSRSLLFILLLLLALLGYASWLSWRIGHLKAQVSAAIQPDGRVAGPFATSRLPDELGDLSRHIGRLMGSLRDYNRYLESFARKLTHELKTPLAVVRSSIDNLRHTAPNEEQRKYLQRAAQGGERLSHILQAMSEASRLEHSIEHTERERFDLAEVVSGACAAYQVLDPQHRIEYKGARSGCPCEGSPELLAQMLDKLVDNARDFTPTSGSIEIRLSRDPRGYLLEVDNEGSQLPAHMRDAIFQAFVSVREQDRGEHLGQGLQIVQLITGFHGGTVSAHNRPGADGVIFSVRLPLPAGVHDA